MRKNYQWNLLVEFLETRRKSSFQSPSYVFYFLIVIIVIGTFGFIKDLIEIDYCFIWHSSCEWDMNNFSKISQNLSSTGLSLVTATILELIFITKNNIKKDFSETLKYHEIENLKKSIRIFGLISLIITFVLWIIINSFDISVISKFILSFITILFAYYIWWISNTRNKILAKNTSLLSILGDATPIQNIIDKTDDNTAATEIIDEIKGDTNGFITK